MQRWQWKQHNFVYALRMTLLASQLTERQIHVYTHTELHATMWLIKGHPYSCFKAIQAECLYPLSY